MPQHSQNHRNPPSGSVNLADKVAGNKQGNKQGAKSSAPRKKQTRKKKVVIGILIGVIVAMLTFLTVGIVMVMDALNDDEGQVKSVSVTSHESTPVDLQGKVGYYVVGLLGKEATDPTESLAILCWDKANNTMTVLELPQDTYLGNSGRWAVTRLADVWGNPKPVNWCSACRVAVEDTEIADGKHTVCGTPITQQKGSSSQDLLAVFNDLLGLPVDGYFLMPQDALVKLVNLLGGVDVTLESAMTVEDITYKAGVQTLDGAAALQYATTRKSGITGDIDRLVRQRKVMLAVFQRLIRQSETQLKEDSVVPLMNGSTPLRTNFVRADIVKLLASMKDLQPTGLTAYVLPGRSVKVKSKTVFAADEATILPLLNEAFNPYRTALTADNLALPEVGSGKVTDMRKQVLSEIAVEQSGAVVTTTEATTTTAAAS